MIPLVATITATAYAAFAVVAPRLEWKKTITTPTTTTTTTWGSRVLAAHNALLSLLSAAMFAAVVAEAFARARIEGSWGFVFCELPEAPRSVAFEAYYVSKYYELLDTVLAFGCKGKRPRHYWMHCYHHCLVLFMAYFYTKGQTLRYPGMAFNTFVHVFMYYYYSRAALGLRSPWKAWITRLQVLQFVTSFIFLILALRRTPNLLFPGSACAGRRALAFNCVFNFTLLLLFLQILFSQPSVRRRRRSSSSKEA